MFSQFTYKQENNEYNSLRDSVVQTWYTIMSILYTYPMFVLIVLCVLYE